MAALAVVDSSRGSPSLDLNYIAGAMTFTPSECCTISCGTVCVDPQTSQVLIIFNRRLGIWQLPKGRKNIGEDLPAAALRETYEETGVQADLLPLKIRTRSTNPSIAGTCDPGSGGRADRGTLHHTSPSTASADSASTACSTPAASEPSLSKPELPGPSSAGGVADTGAADDARHAGHAVGSATTRRPGPAADRAAAADPKLTINVFNNELVGVIQYPDLQAATPNTVKFVFYFAALADSTVPMGPGAQEEHEDLQAEWVEFRVADERLRFGPEKEAMWKVKRDLTRSGIGG